MANSTQHSDLKAAIAAERKDVAGILESLTPDQWEVPSLCAGWRVREVAAHMSAGFRYSTAAMALEVLKAGGVNRMADRCARRDAAALSTAEITASLRENAYHPWTPPVGGPPAALGHDVIHGLDMTVPLGLGRRVPADRLRVVLGSIRPLTLRIFGSRKALADITLRAEDLEWSLGTGGSVVTGAAQDLLLVAFGRKLPKGHLHGPEAGRFTGS